jgi:molybdopterin-guanine dinucleotide biosynthesis protein B
MIASPVPLLGFCAWGSGIGKTTLLTSLIPQLRQRGLRISVVKHAHHSFDIDHPGKDSYRIREAGAVQTLLGSRQRWALMTEVSHIEPQRQEPDLAELLTHMDPTMADIILVEGFKQEAIPKIEVYRPSLGNPLLAENDAFVIAIATDGDTPTTLPVLDLNNPAAIADFVLAWLEQQRKTHKLASSYSMDLI